jgi:ArsR family transcriptional regulator
MNSNDLLLDTESQSLLKENLPNNKVCNKLACFYSMFGDPTRLKIIISLLIKEMCVNDLSKILNINQTTISHQLKILKTYGIVSSTRKNKFVFYHITDKFVNNIMINGVDYLINKKRA